MHNIKFTCGDKKLVYSNMYIYNSLIDMKFVCLIPVFWIWLCVYDYEWLYGILYFKVEINKSMKILQNEAFSYNIAFLGII